MYGINHVTMGHFNDEVIEGVFWIFNFPTICMITSRLYSPNDLGQICRNDSVCEIVKRMGTIVLNSAMNVNLIKLLDQRVRVELELIPDLFQRSGLRHGRCQLCFALCHSSRQHMRLSLAAYIILFRFSSSGRRVIFLSPCWYVSLGLFTTKQSTCMIVVRFHSSETHLV